MNPHATEGLIVALAAATHHAAVDADATERVSQLGFLGVDNATVEAIPDDFSLVEVIFGDKIPVHPVGEASGCSFTGASPSRRRPFEAVSRIFTPPTNQTTKDSMLHLRSGKI